MKEVLISKPVVDKDGYVVDWVNYTVWEED